MDKSGFMGLVASGWRMRLYFLWKLPSAWFFGLRVVHCDSEKCSVRLPFRWQSKNPFRSMYFAAQCAAGELSSGILAMAALTGGPAVSMLVLRIEAEFLKKAAAPVVFTCAEGRAIESAVQTALGGTEAQVLRVAVTGLLSDGSVAANVWITWSFRRKSQVA